MSVYDEFVQFVGAIYPDRKVIDVWLVAIHVFYPILCCLRLLLILRLR